MIKMKKNTRSNLITYSTLIIVFALVYILNNAHVLTNSLSGQLVPICAYICMAISLNLTVGILGELSLGHAGFMSVGAFTGVIVSAGFAKSVPDPTARLVIAVLFGALMAGIAGLIVGIPVLRLHGDYLAIVTLAFGEIIKNLLNNLYVGIDSRGLHFSMTNTQALNMDGGTVVINGPMGATSITRASTFVFGFVMIFVILIIALNMINSRTGRAIMALRDNSIAAESVGISISKYKLIAFVTSAAMAGMAGVLYAMNYSTIVPKKFDFNTSILILVFIVLGGIGNIRGGMIAATVLTILPEVLRSLNDYRMLIYAIILILVMIITNNSSIRNWFSSCMGKFFALFSKKKTLSGNGGTKDE